MRSPFAPRRTVLVRLVSGIALAVGLAASTIQAQIPGRNVNMVSGTKWPEGDPFLQRQNEPSIAASTRNPLHLLAGANDYRTVDLPGLLGDETGDAWLGLFKSYDGGQRWNSTLLPGYPQDESCDPVKTPDRDPVKCALFGYGAGADPVVRAGNSGLIYYAGLVFDRTPTGVQDPGKSAIFVSRFIDNNNNEAGNPFAYLGTRKLATDPGGATGNFLDKPWLAVDIPRDATRCTITSQSVDGPFTQSVPAGPVYVAYTLKSRDTLGDRYDVFFTRSADCGNTWTVPVKVNNVADRANQGATIAIDPRNGDVHVAWRRFDLTGDNDAIMAIKFSATGKKFDPPKEAHKPKKTKKDKKKAIDPAVFYTKGGVSKAIQAAELSPFDQATSDIAELLAFRTNAYPSLTVDHTGRVYMAWAERGFDPNLPDPVAGDARILVSTSVDGKKWTAAQAIAVEGQQGHQLMPTITFAGGKLMLVYYDLRETRSQVFSQWIDDVTALAGAKQRRHTIDLRASMGTPGAVPVFEGSVPVSEYLVGADATGARRQLQVNPPNLPMFKKGTAPFMGDYVDVTAAPNFVTDATGKWIYNTAASATPPVFHAAWTDNRDVRPPLEDTNGDSNPWNDFSPAGALGNTTSIFDLTTPIAQCIPGNAGSRNQNIYTARITGGILAGSPGNTKRLSTDFQRAFVVFVQNTTATTKTFRLTITSQPPGGRASFNQFLLPPFTNTEPALTAIDTKVTSRSTSSRTVYVTSSDPHARLNISVAEVSDIGGGTLTGGLGSVIVLNPDIDNPDIDNPDIDNPDIDNPDIDNPDIDNAEVYNPDIDNPDIDNPDIDNPDIDNPDIDNPDIDNVRVANPDIDNPAIANPDIDNPDIDNPDIDNPDIDNPDIDNAPLTDVSWTITNTGNTTAAYNVNLFFAQTTIKPELTTQLILYRTYRTPVVKDCVLKYETHNVLVANVPNPELVKSSTGEVSDPNDPEPTNATIWLAPGESAKITLRIADTNPGDNIEVTNADGTKATIDPGLVPNEDVTPVVQQQSADTEEVAAGTIEPPIVVQFPAPQTVPDAASTAPLTPVTINVLANDSTAFGSTKVFSLHPPGMATHSGGGPGDIAYQSSTGFLYTQRGIVDPATNALVGRLPLPPAGGLVYQVANQRTGINYGRSGGSVSALTALDARPGTLAIPNPTFHQYLPIPALPSPTDTVLSIALDATNGRLYAVHGPAQFGPATPTTVTAIDINPASPGFHTILGSVSLPAGTRGQAIAVNTRTQKIYISTTNTNSGIYMIDPTVSSPVAVKITGGNVGVWSIAVHEAANLIYGATSSSNNYALIVIDGNTGATTQVNTTTPMRFDPVDERMVVHQATGRVFMRLESSVVVIDTQRGSPTRNTVVATIPNLGLDGGGTADIAIDQQLGVIVTVGGFDYKADVINAISNPPVWVTSIPLLAGPTDVDIDPVNHRAFVAVPLTYVQEFSLFPIGADPAAVPVFVESGGLVINPVKAAAPFDYNRAYAGILAVGGSMGVVSGTGFGGTVNGLNPASRFLFSARHNGSNRFWIVSFGNPAGTSAGPGKVIVIDGATDTLEETVAVATDTTGHPNPFGIGIDQADNKVYVGTLPGNNIVGAITVFNALDPQQPRVDAPLVSGFPRNLSFVNNVLTPTGLVGFGRHIVVNSNGPTGTHKVYAMQIGASPTSLAVYDPVTNLVSALDGLTSAPVNGLPAAPSSPTNAPGAWGRVDVIRVDPAANRIYLGMFDAVTNTNRIVALNGANHEVVGSWIGGKHSNRHTASYLIVNEGGNRLYVTNYDNDTVTMLDASSMLPIGAPLTLPEGPSAMAFNETSNRLYVSSIDAKMLTAIDGETLTIQSSIRMPLVAQFIYVDDVESRIYTSGGDSADESGVMVITDVLGQLGTTVSVSGITQPDHGVVVLNADYSVTYTPDGGYDGPDSFGYAITAPTGTANGVVNITVVRAHPASVAFGDNYATPLNQNLTVAAPGPLANDATGDPAATMVVTNTTDHGVLAPQTDGSFAYNPGDTFNGLDSFDYHTVGVLGSSNTVTVTISVASGVQFVVTNTNDSGVGSLRQAMTIANLEPGSAIAFNIPGVGPHVIAPSSPLPTINVPVTIDGYTQNDPTVANSAAAPNTAGVGTNAVLKIVLQGPASGNNPTGLTLRGGNSIVRGLVISGWSQTNVPQTGPVTYSGQGILLDNLGNNLIEGNFIGTNAAGTAAAPNATGVSSQSPGNLIGGSTPASRNLISGNNNQGARALASSNNGVATSIGSGTKFKNNLIGTAATGMTALPNGGGGLTMSAPGVIIGGTTAGERNVISGNIGTGINAFANVFNGTPVSVPAGLTVQGNYIGTTADGMAALANSGGGVSSSGLGTIIGGTNPTPLTGCAGACNVISGNTGTGLSLTNSYDSNATSPTAGTLYSSAANSFVEGNYIGVNVNGTLALANSSQGIQLSAPGITVGGGSAATRNVISGNGGSNGSGISAGSSNVTNATTGTGIAVATAQNAWIRGNHIGLNAAGTGAVPNANGISVSVPDVSIGGIVAADRNVVSGNLQSGINTGVSTFTPGGAFPVVVLAVPARLIVKGNYIGVTADGTSAVANAGNGIYVTGEDSVIGGLENMSPLSCTGACNLIAGNTNGTNSASGLSVTNQFNNTPGPGLGTLYSSASGTKVLGNFIGVNLNGTAAIPNSSGMSVNAPDVIVGGPAAGARNVVSGNTGSGISVGTSYVTSTNLPVALGSGTGSKIKGNLVGISVDGTTRIANGQCGICSNAAGVFIGGPNMNEGNRVVGGTSSTGINLSRQLTFPGNVLVDAGGTSTVEGNVIGLSTTNTRLNGGTGIHIASASNHIVGNVVAGNGSTVPTVPLVFATGIRVSGSFANFNSIRGNTVGTNLAGATGLGNSSTGVSLQGASNTTIGGLNAADRNVIVGNGANGGIEFYASTGDTMTGNQILGNYIGALPGGGAIANNTGIRIYANPVQVGNPNPAGIISDNTIGGSAPGARNVISGNNGDGINLGGGGTTNNSIVGNYIGTTINGLGALPNTGSGVSLGEGGANSVGGAGAGDGNLIAFNGARGVAVFSGVRNRILSNAIHSNGNVAIDLNNDGATANDNGDGDTGGNNRQNYPVVLTASTSGGSTAVDADFSSFAPGQYTVQFFASAQCDVNGNSRSEQLVGSFDSVPPGGVQTFQLSPAVAAGQYITATATDGLGNTSELSSCFIQVDVVPTEVTNTNDSGGGSLRSAITYANSAPGTQTITFKIPGGGPHTIQPTSMLPVITAPVIIDGYSQLVASPNTLSNGGTNAALKIVINGANAAGAWAGLAVGGGGGGTTIRGLVINGFSAFGAAGVLLDSPSGGDVVAGNFIGTDATGMAAVPNEWGVITNSPNSVIGGSAAADRNLISGNTQSGAHLSSSVTGLTVNYAASGSSVRNNLVGTNASGMAALANLQNGIQVSVAGVTIGGTNAADRNVLSGNGVHGISAYGRMFGATTVPSGLRIEGNFIGTNAAGMAAIANGGSGIFASGPDTIVGGSLGTTAGGACTGACNLLSGNNSAGVQVNANYDPGSGTLHSSAANSVVAGNYIGVNVLGTAAVPNGNNGIEVNAPTVTIGGATPGARNVVSGNSGSGIFVGAAASNAGAVLASGSGSVIRGNFIGVNAAGTAALTNGFAGVSAATPNVTIGGPTPADRNVVASSASGMSISLGSLAGGSGVVSSGNNTTVQGNHIGVDESGTVPLAVGGVAVSVFTINNQFLGNVIARSANGISISGSPTAPGSGNVIKGNYIGTSPAGATNLGNSGSAVFVNNASGTVIGGSLAQDRNVIAGNTQPGITVYTSSSGTASGTVIAGNYIGLLPDGVTAHGNSGGINLSPAPGGTISGTVIGGASAGARNVIASNAGNGIGLYGTGTTNTTIAGNYIGVAANGSTARGNTAAGVWVSDSANNTIGGSNAADANIIAFNSQIGVGVQGNTALGNRISGNRIFGNGGTGIDLNSGGNNSQAAPALSNAANAGPTTTVDANLSGLAAGSYTVEFFASATCSGPNGQGERLVGRFLNVLSGPAAPFTLTELVPAGQFITATATDLNGNTSEFSACAQVGASNPLTVINTNDSGAGSLRAAIDYANTTPGSQTISFNITGATPGAPAVISVASPLPTINEAAIIDGFTQPGHDTVPVIEVRASVASSGWVGFNLNANNITVRGLMITRFNEGIFSLQGLNGHLIEDNIIGTNLNADVGLGNNRGIVWRASTSLIRKNTVSGNAEGLVLAMGGSANIVSDNKIGSGRDGVTPRPNSGHGVVLYDGANNNLFDGNVISGNGDRGVDIQHNVGLALVTATRFINNTIGLDTTGAALRNTRGGIRLNNAPATVIGEVGGRNIISGNGGPNPFDIGLGIEVSGNALPMPVIQGNYIGTDATGLVARPNVNKGISLDGPAVVGGDQPGQGNLISGHAGVGAGAAGIIVGLGGGGSIIRGNTIGLSANGSVLGNSYAGITVFSTSGVTIGGTTAGARNVISGNGSFGISFPVGPTSGTIVEGNYIGTDATGTAARANGGRGISVSGGTNHRIGGDTASAGNLIMNNAGAGVVITGASSGVRVLSNQISANSGLGIDLGGDGVTGNEPDDLDTGANNLQNFPTLTAAVKTGPTSLDVTANLVDFAPGAYTFEFFAQPACDASGHGEGQVYLGRVNSFVPGGTTQVFSLAQAVVTGWQITGTATDAGGNTSEFSGCTVVTASPYTMWSASGTGTVAVMNNGSTGIPQMTYTQTGAFSGNWQFATLAATNGTVGLSYGWNGFHSYYNVRAAMDVFVSRGGVDIVVLNLVNAGPADCCSSPSGGFSYSGSTSVSIQPGDTYGFRLRGSHGDSALTLNGTLSLTVTP